MKNIIIFVTIIASYIWAFNVKNLSDCIISEEGSEYSYERKITIKCQNPFKYEIEASIKLDELDDISEYIYTENSKKIDALFFDPEGNGHHQISEQDEYDVYIRMSNKIIASNKLNKMLMKKWEYFKKLKKQIENKNNKKIIYQKTFKEQSTLKSKNENILNETREVIETNEITDNTDTTETNEYVPDGGWYSDNKEDCPPSWKKSDGTCKDEWFLG